MSPARAPQVNGLRHGTNQSLCEQGDRAKNKHKLLRIALGVCVAGADAQRRMNGKV